MTTTKSFIKGLDMSSIRPRRTIKRASRFHVVINLNISYKQLQLESTLYRVKMVQDIIKTLELFKQELAKRQFMINNDQDIKLEQYRFHLEVGAKRKFVHLDGWIFFDKFCHLDSRAIQNWFNDKLLIYTRGTFCNVSYVPDNISAIQQYSQKDGNVLV